MSGCFSVKRQGEGLVSVIVKGLGVRLLQAAVKSSCVGSGNPLITIKWAST
jgi:hypothetical protein